MGVASARLGKFERESYHSIEGVQISRYLSYEATVLVPLAERCAVCAISWQICCIESLAVNHNSHRRFAITIVTERVFYEAGWMIRRLYSIDNHPTPPAMVVVGYVFISRSPSSVNSLYFPKKADREDAGKTIQGKPFCYNAT